MTTIFSFKDPTECKECCKSDKEDKIHWHVALCQDCVRKHYQNHESKGYNVDIAKKCLVCAVFVCPHDESFHFDVDGCPECDVDGE